MKLTLAKSTLVTFVAAGMMAPASKAASVGLYTFEGNLLNASEVAPHLTLSSFSASGVKVPNPAFAAGSTGVAGASTKGSAYTALNWSTSALDPNKYFQFTISPQTGYLLTLTSLQLDERRSASGLLNWDVRSSLNNYTSSLSTFSVPDDANFRVNQTTTLNAAFSNLSNPITFRLYGYNVQAKNGTDTWRVDNVQVSGSVTPVPFEFSPTLGLLTLGVWGAVAQIRRNRKNN